MVVEEYPEPIEDAVDVEPIVSEPTIEVETTSDTSEEVSTPMSSETDEREANFQRKAPHLLLKNLISHQNMRCFVPMQ